MSDMMANHITLRVPGEEDTFLTNAYGLMYEEITASSLYKIDHDGKVLTKPDFGDLQYGINIPGFILHSAIHKARPEVNCVIHTHTWPGMAISSLEVGLLPLNQTSMRF
jgi:ribulose-5-phosphate 4-epimerase/fuculose-1-phosphate aldolase